MFIFHQTQIVGVNIFGDGGRHSSDHQIKLEHLHHPFVHYPVNRSSVPETFLKRANDSRSDTNGKRKFLKIQRIHIEYVHISYRLASKILQLDTKKRSAQSISVASFFHQEFYQSDDFRIFLHFVKEDKCLAGNHFRLGKR